MNPKNKPAFMRQEWFRMGNQRRKWRKWRRPRGNQSKLRMHMAGKGFLPNPGWGAPKALRSLHPSGFREVAVSSIRQLSGLDPARFAVRIAGGVGALKRLKIQQAAAELKLKILNPKKIELRCKKIAPKNIKAESYKAAENKEAGK